MATKPQKPAPASVDDETQPKYWPGFSDERTAGTAPYAGAAPDKWHAHTSAAIKGFYVVVGRPDDKGAVERWYGVRYGVMKPDGKPGEAKAKLGAVGAMKYSAALALATGRVEAARVARREGKPLVLTLKAAFEDYIAFKTKRVALEKRIRPRTEEDYRDRFNELIPLSWHTEPLDRLTPKHWEDLRTDCLNTRTMTQSNKLRATPGGRDRRPVSESRFDVMMKGWVSGVYRRQAENCPGLVNPTKSLRKQDVLSGTKLKDAYIPSDKLAVVWAHLEQEVRPAQADCVRIGLLTGWRLQLMTKIPLDRIKPEKRAVEWRDTDEGGPYTEGQVTAFDYPVSDWLWETVFAPRLASAKPGQRYLIETTRPLALAKGEPKPPKGEKVPVGHRPFKDVRDSLAKLDDIVGVHITAHVLRKTMMSLAPRAKIHQAIISQLAMHKTGVVGSNTTTTDYQKRDFEAMKEGANEWAEWLRDKVGARSTAAVPGVSASKVEALQKLASIPDEALAKLLRMVEAMK